MNQPSCSRTAHRSVELLDPRRSRGRPRKRHAAIDDPDVFFNEPPASSE
nr:MAG TPA: hypothetical protein [Caudoviricetes sp.]